MLTAASGEEGVRLAREQHPDVITLDILMPGMDGWAVLRDAEERPRGGRDPRRHDHHGGRPRHGERAGRGGLPAEAHRPRAPLRGAAEVRVHATRRAPSSWWRTTPPTRELMRRTLASRRAGTSARRRTAARRWHLVAGRRPDLILLDLMMPEMDGFEFVEQLRANAAWREIPVVVVTAKDLHAGRPGAPERPRTQASCRRAPSPTRSWPARSGCPSRLQRTPARLGYDPPLCPIGSPSTPATSALCESQSWRDWSGFFAVSSYEVHHEREYNAIRNAAALIDISPLFKYRRVRQGRGPARGSRRDPRRDQDRGGPGGLHPLVRRRGQGHRRRHGVAPRGERLPLDGGRAEPALVPPEQPGPRRARSRTSPSRPPALALQGPTSRDILEGLRGR